MRKLLSCFLVATLTASLLVGCGSSGGGNDAAASTGSAASESKEAGSASSDASDASASTSDAIAALPEALSTDVVIKATPEMYPDVDLSDPYTVHLYLIGDKPRDWDRVLDEVNGLLTPFNTSLDVVYISWADIGTMYSLSLAGGEEIDAVYTAPWNYMYTENLKGSFYTFDMDFIEKYMPLTYRYQDHDSFSEATVKGEIIAIPSNMEKSDTKIVAIRQDLADKYGIDKLENWDDYMNYMLTIAEKETPESGILAEAAQGNNSEVWDVYRQQFDTFYAYKGSNLHYIFSYNGGNPTEDDIQMVWNTDWFRSFAHDMKTLADAGCWSRGALSATVSDDDAFANLQGASIAWNGTVFNYMESAEKNDGVECAAYDLTKDNLVACEEYNNSDLAIAAASRNPERTAMMLDILKMDTEINRLITLGFEGEHYTVEGNNGFLYAKADKAEEYPPDGCSLSWAIRNGLYEQSGTPERRKVMEDNWDSRIVSNPVVTFVFDTEPVSSEVAACETALGDYVPALQLGLVEDVDAELDKMNADLERAGIAAVEEEFFRQYNEWLATR